jgi:lipopolysaccharide/colanic/teichoic acid biosynthesis glycosyltransferase
MAQRFFDILLSILGIFLLSPLFLIVILIIRIDSKGTVFFTQNRVGLNGTIFKIIKFRTMKISKEKNNINLTIGTKDPRITKTGYILRKFKIDELPQIFNVFIGHMSFVGPRPEIPEYVKYYNKQDKKILNIKPGITDWASIKYLDENNILGKSHNPEKTYITKIMKEKLSLNNYYLNNYNLKTYFTIIFFTIFSIIKTLITKTR